MADFSKAYEITVIGIEGGYNPGNGEAETYRGIDRSANPNWTGWKVIDAVKVANPGYTTAKMNTILAANTALQVNIQSFYQVNYWDTLKLSQISDQQVANALFDCSVNPCIISAAKAVQIACNTLKQGLLVVDGVFGAKSLAGVNSLDPGSFVTAFNGLRVANYYDRVRLTPDNKQWLSSWLGRCKPYK